jgi:putative SOS response-associated peptidase YedK
MCGKVRLDKSKLSWFNYSTTNGLVVKPANPIPVMFRNKQVDMLSFGWSNFYNVRYEKLNTSEHRVIIPAKSFFEKEQEYEIPDSDYIMGIKRDRYAIILTAPSKVLGRAPLIVGHNEFFVQSKSSDYATSS